MQIDQTSTGKPGKWLIKGAKSIWKATEFQIARVCNVAYDTQAAAFGLWPHPRPGTTSQLVLLRFLRKLREKLAGLAGPARRRLSSALLKTVTAALLRHSQRF